MTSYGMIPMIWWAKRMEVALKKTVYNDDRTRLMRISTALLQVNRGRSAGRAFK